MLPCPRSRLRTWSRETGLAVPSRVSLLISILRLNLLLTYGIPFNNFKPPYAIGSRNCLPMAFTAESPPAVYTVPGNYYIQYVLKKHTNASKSYEQLPNQVEKLSKYLGGNREHLL